MQNRYTCDVGDFAKYGLMRQFNQDGFSTALAWYLFPDEGHNADGKYINYIGCDEFRCCDPCLHDQMKNLILKDQRNISAVERSKILGSNTLFHSDPLNFNDLCSSSSKVGKTQRKERREKWLSDCINKTEGSDIVFFDPDNGLEVSKPRPISNKGPKFIYWSDLKPFVKRYQTLVIYNHASRQGAVKEQIKNKLLQVKRHLPYGANAAAMLWRRFSVRYFIIIPTDEMKGRILNTCKEMEKGKWKNFFELIT